MRKVERPALPSAAAGHEEGSATKGGHGDAPAALGRNPAMMFGFFLPERNGDAAGGQLAKRSTRHLSPASPPPPTRTRLAPRGLCSVFCTD